MPHPLLLEIASGLCIRQCFDCGEKLELQPLHCLAMMAYYLTTEGGREDEDLFGMLACALCLKSCGFDPGAKADVSVPALLDLDALVECSHEEFTAAGLAERILAAPEVDFCSTKLQTGWSVLSGVLRCCENAHVERIFNDGSDSEDESAEHEFMGSTEPDGWLRDTHRHYECEPEFCFLGRRDLATPWASAQAELLSCRRLEDDSGWVSEYFPLKILQKQLERSNDLMVGYSQKNLLRAYCACHSFSRSPLTLLSEALNPDLANHDVWGRATYGALFE